MARKEKRTNLAREYRKTNKFKNEKDFPKKERNSGKQRKIKVIIKRENRIFTMMKRKRHSKKKSKMKEKKIFMKEKNYKVEKIWKWEERFSQKIDFLFI